MTGQGETPATSGAGSLRVEGVAKRFGGAVALEGLTLELAAGESLGIAGPNGSGKTTLVDVISGFLRPDRGRVWFDGREITRWPPHRIVREGIARTFQCPQMASRFTVQQHLEAATLHRGLRSRERREIVNQILETIGLARVRGREIRTLSWGEIRRAELGRALATGARVLLLDEPLASLSLEDAPDMLSALRRLRREGRTMLIAAQGPAVFQALCDRVAVIAAGQVIRSGRPADVRGA